MSKPARAMRTPGTVRDLHAWCTQYQRTFPCFDFNVQCWHYETRTRTHYVNGQRRTSTHTVRVTTLKTLLEEHRVERLDAMKIDVEGGEAAILSAYFHDVQRGAWPQLIIMERPSVNAASGADDPVALACAKGYRVARETRMNAILTL